MPKLVDIEDMRKCFKCGSFDTYTDADGNEHWAYNYDDNKKWTGDYLCNKCRMTAGEMKKYYKDRYDEIKYVRDCRNARINVGSEKCKGCIGAQICANTLGVDILDIEMDNFRYYVDLSKHDVYGFIEVKIATFNKRDGRWYVHKVNKENFDTLLIVCMDQYEPWRNVLKLYAIPSSKISTSTTITIYENKSIRGSRWYEEFEIDAKPFNDTYHSIDINKCPMLSRKSVV